MRYEDDIHVNTVRRMESICRAALLNDNAPGSELAEGQFILRPWPRLDTGSSLQWSSNFCSLQYYKYLELLINNWFYCLLEYPLSLPKSKIQSSPMMQHMQVATVSDSLREVLLNQLQCSRQERCAYLGNALADADRNPNSPFCYCHCSVTFIMQMKQFETIKWRE